MSKYCVGLYECNRSFGGPEEGGWYYNSGELVKPMQEFESEDDAYKYVLDEENKYMEDFGTSCRESYRKAVSYGMRISWYSLEVHEDKLPPAFPEYTPRYE